MCFKMAAMQRTNQKVTKYTDIVGYIPIDYLRGHSSKVDLLKHRNEVGSLLQVLIETPGSYVRVIGLLQDVPLPT